MPTPPDDSGHPAQPTPAAVVPVVRRTPSPIPAGVSIVDYVLNRPESLLEALDAVLAGPVGVRVTVNSRSLVTQHTAEQLHVEVGVPLAHRSEAIVQRHPDSLHCYGMVLYELLPHRLPPALRHRLDLETGPVEAALRRHQHAGPIHRALVDHDAGNTNRSFIIGDEHGPIGYALEMLWARGDQLVATVIDLARTDVSYGRPVWKLGS